MAKSKGLLKIEGTLDGMTFYKSQDGYLVRTKGGVFAKRIANDAAFARTRENNKNGPEHRGSLTLSPEQLIEQLKRQSRIGKAGELIAYHYEVARLKKLEIENPASCIERVSLTNTAQGYDMASITPLEKRYIEFKSTMRNKNRFFLSENEVITLETLGKSAYLYLVHVTDLKTK
jgi:hypothetical protein